ncbi:MAG: GNAT family N-acetyltransferase [Anaerolineales bacterium]|nr:GNAT family N-acetyltransferase [Anaerolineales bacterium]
MLDEIKLIEELALRAWPAEIADALDGWWMRWHKVSSRRVNSVWPNAWDGMVPLALKLEKVEFFYAMRGQPARYQICPAARPAGLDEVLEARGYTVDARTAVQVAEVDKVIQAAQPAQAEVKLFETLDDEWLEGYCWVQEENLKSFPSRREALARVAVPSVYGLVYVDGEVAAVGRGVFERGWMGVFGMATGAGFRRQGLATSILGALAARGQESGAEKMYLQVMENNSGAQALYGKLGFSTLYHYHYREQNLKG